jgi:hypothetical protein
MIVAWCDLKAAKALGLTISQSIFLQADRVMQGGPGRLRHYPPGCAVAH